MSQEVKLSKDTMIVSETDQKELLYTQIVTFVLLLDMKKRS